jgi:transposase
MSRYIGLDVHSQSTALAIVNESGRKLASHIVETNARALLTALKPIPRPRHLIMEEGTQSAWLTEVLAPHVDEVVVCIPRKKAFPAKSDVADAFARAEELRRNAVDRVVYKPKLTALRHALSLYTPINKDLVRAKGRYRALLRSRGVNVDCANPYEPTPEELAATFDALPLAMHFSAEKLLEEVYLLQQLRDAAAKNMVAEARQHPMFKKLMTVPGFREVRSATVLAIVVTPHRFRKPSHFWSYCGLAVRTETSGEFKFESGKRVRQREALTRGLKHGNALLKNAFKGAAFTVTTMRTTHPMKQHYEKLVRNGMKESIARVTVARKLAAIVLAMWKSQEAYDPTKHKIHL